MPLFLWTVATSFLVHYWVEKYELLRVRTASCCTGLLGTWLYR